MKAAIALCCFPDGLAEILLCSLNVSTKISEIEIQNKPLQPGFHGYLVPQTSQLMEWHTYWSSWPRLFWYFKLITHLTLASVLSNRINLVGVQGSYIELLYPYTYEILWHVECKKLGKIFTCPTYELLSNFVVISDVYRSFIPNKTTLIIPPAQRSCWGGILVSLRPSVRPSVCPSVRPSVRPAFRVRSVSSTVMDGFFSY